MKEDELEDFKSWMEMQPDDYVRYKDCREFISGLLDIKEVKAEVEMANLSNEEIKVISSGGGRRVFSLPLDDLTESIIKNEFSGQYTEAEYERVANKVRGKTGHDLKEIIEFIRSLDNVVDHGEVFSWEVETEPEDEHY